MSVHIRIKFRVVTSAKVDKSKLLKITTEGHGLVIVRLGGVKLRVRGSLALFRGPRDLMQS